MLTSSLGLHVICRIRACRNEHRSLQECQAPGVSTERRGQALGMISDQSEIDRQAGEERLPTYGMDLLRTVLFIKPRSGRHCTSHSISRRTYLYSWPSFPYVRHCKDTAITTQIRQCKDPAITTQIVARPRRLSRFARRYHTGLRYRCIDAIVTRNE